MTPATISTASEPASVPLSLRQPFSSTTKPIEANKNKHDEHQTANLPTTKSFVVQATTMATPNVSQPATATTNSSTITTTNTSTPLPPPNVYGELSILGYNGYIPNGEKGGRRNRSKFLLCQRSIPNGIKKSRHYFVKHPQATKAIQDKELHSISFTFSRSQTIIVEYRQDETTDMFQIGRSSEDPIDFIVLDTLPASCNLSNPVPDSGGANNNGRHASKHSASNNHYHHHNENASSSNQQHQQQILAGDIAGLSRLHRHLAKVGEEMLQYGFPPGFYDHRARLHMQAAAAASGSRPHNQAMPMSFPHFPSNFPPPMIAEQLRNQNLALAHQHANHLQQNLAPAPSSSSHHHQQQFLSSVRSNHLANSSSNNGDLELNSSGGSGRHNNTTNDTNNNHNNNSNNINNNNLICKRSRTTQSTISRFACRILVDRKPPCTARIYAAGFDSSKNIFLGEKATKWEQNNSIDGLTTNGVLLMHPKRSDELSDSGGIWREVSVDGGIYAIRESRSAVQKGKRIEEETNILQDGTLIDLCGATLLWRSVDGFKSSPTKKSLEEKIDLLNASRPQCPVNLNTLVIPRRPILPNHLHHNQHQNQQQSSHSHSHHRGGPSEHQHGGHNHRHHHNDRHQRQHNHHQHSHGNHNHSNGSNNSNCDNGNSSPKKDAQQPYVYLKCGHVQGYHDWGTTEKSNQRTCPICFSVGMVAKLSMGLEPSFYVDCGPLTHVFNPCGHMASEKTVRYWSSIKIPHGTHFFHSICPFCATQLAIDEKEPWTKLIFQDDLD